MDRERALDFVHKHQHTTFYQPVVFEPGLIEIRGKWNKATKELASMLSSEVREKSVLDLGCNIGFFLHEFARHAIRLTGIDHDPAIIQIAREIESILSDNVELAVADMQTYASSGYDIVLMLNVLHAIPDPLQCLEKYLSLCNLVIVEQEIGYLDLSIYNIKSRMLSPRAFKHREILYLRGE